jgi:hypothetical protein
MDIVCGYDIKVDNHQVTLNIARDLITALLTFDKIYIEGNHIWDILQVWGSEYVKELLRLHILCVIPDQELNPVMMREGKGEWKHGRRGDCPWIAPTQLTQISWYNGTYVV